MNQIQDILRTMEYGPAPEEDTHVRAWLKRHDGRFGHFIDGRFSKPSGKSFKVFDPSNGQEIAEVADGTEKDVDRAVKAATSAFVKWSALSGNQRARHLYALARSVQKHSRFLAVLETIDNGKPIRETRDLDIPLV
ncbi:MAG: aldehyde dehydrogenase family protein, partial [Rhizobiaceae bacterium]